MSKVVRYIIGADRNNPEKSRAHYYAITAFGKYWPMCDYAWNRSDGQAFSILRGWGSSRGECRLCLKNMAEGKRPVVTARVHKTRWL